MTTVGFVHGAYHGAWCWELLTPELQRRGHQVLTVDLPTENPLAGTDEYAAAAVAAFAEADADLVLVGHSLAGLTLPVVAQARPVSRIVYLAAMLPRPGRAQDDVIAREPDMILPGPEGGAFIASDGSVRWHPEAAARWFFDDCPPEVAKWASARLRGQFWTITQEVTPLQSLPDVPSTYLVGANDPVLNPSWARRTVPAVLGITPVELAGGHSPFLATPGALAEALTALG